LAGIVLVSATPRFTASDDFPYGLPGAEAAGMRLKLQRSPQRALAGFHSRLFAESELEASPVATEINRLLSTIPTPDTAAALDALDALAGTDMRHLLAAVSVPTLIMHGAADRICLPQASYYLKERIAGAEQVVFPRCGHAPFLTYSDQFNDELIRFARSACEQIA
jgi:pimeloyl-[acyl-carrier protein] methyl ester esterase